MTKLLFYPNSLKSALVPFFAGIPVRTGYIGEFRLGLLNDARKLNKTKLPLMVERFAQLAEQAGINIKRPLPDPQLNISKSQRDAALKKLGLKAGKIYRGTMSRSRVRPCKALACRLFCGNRSTITATRLYGVDDRLCKR